ncbi:MAG: TonB-dependent receptor domain-containing protein, partial [Chitinophagaceae bacterium]
YFYITVPAVATTPPTPASGSLNEKLQPEKGTQLEFGTRGELFRNKLSFEVIKFHTLFRKKMTAIAVSSPLSPNTTLYSYMVNGGTQIHNGLELTLKYTAYESGWSTLRLVRPFFNLTRNHFTYGDNFMIEKSATLKEDYSRKDVAAVARYVLNAGLDVLFKKGLSGNLTYNYRDKMPITSLNDFYTPSFNLLNAKLSYQKEIGKHIQLDLSYGINNITGTKHFLMVFANQLPDAYIPAPRKANSFATVQVKYKFER